MPKLDSSQWLPVVAALVLASSCKPDLSALRSGNGSDGGGTGTGSSVSGDTGGGGATQSSASAGSGGSAGDFTGVVGAGTAAKTGGSAGQTGASGGAFATGGTGGAGAISGAGGTSSSETIGVAGTTACEIPTLVPGVPPLLKYDFDSGTGSTAVDSSGNSRDGILVGVPVWSTGRLAGALSFNSANQFVELPVDVIRSLSAITVAAWVRLSANPKGATLFDFGSSGTNHFYLRTNSGIDGSPGISYGMQVNGDTPLEVVTKYNLPTTFWKHIALTVGNGMAVLYIDGLPVNTRLFNFEPSSLGSTGGNWIARTHSNTANYYGAVDDFRIYDRAVSAAEAEALAPPGADHYHFNFDEPCGNSAHDRSEKALVASLPSGGSWTNGRVGGALHLDGNGQYLELPTGVVQACSDLTVAMWVQRNTVSNWERLFTVGQGLTSMMTMTPATHTRFLHFSARLNGEPERDSATQQTLQSANPGLSPQSGIWSHVAVVLQSGTTGRLYFEGNEIATGSVTTKPSDLGATSINSIGQPLYAGETYLGANIDDLRISCRGLTPAEIKIIAMTDP